MASREASYSMQQNASAAVTVCRHARIGTITHEQLFTNCRAPTGSPSSRRCSKGSRRSGRATAACTATFLPAPPSVPLKRSQSMKKDRWSSTSKLASVVNIVSTPVPGMSSPKMTSQAKPASAQCAATESARTNNRSVSRLAPWTL